MKKKCETFSDCKSWCKSIWSSTKRKRVRSGPVFYRKGERVLFNFQHFVKPEKIVEEYTRVNIYNKPRLVKINKRESPVPSISASFVHEKRVPLEVDPRRSKSKCEKTRANVADVTEERIPGWRLKKSVETVPKRTTRRRVPKRISATHNFVYEFDPFANSSSPSNNSNAITRGRDVSNTGLGDSSVKSAGDKQNSSNAQIHGTMLPKLNSRNDVVTEKRNPVGEIDREVEKVKSDWRTLRTEGRWIEGKHCANARTKKLYDTLERMTKEIDKIQRSYLAPKSNEFLHRSVVKTLDRPRISFEEKVEKIKDTLFPKAPEKIVDEAFKNVSSDHLKNDLPHEISSKDVHSIRKSNKKSYISDVQVASGKRCTKSAGSQLEDANAIDRINKKKINADVEQYLEKYINEAEKNLVNGKKKSKMKELDISSKDVASMLKKLNINPYDIQYEIMEDQGEENFSLPSAERLRSGRKQNCPRAIVDRKIGNATVNEKDEQSMLRKNKRNSDTSIQTTTKTNYEENAFIEMGLRTLGNDISRNAMSRVLQSEFLKKDVSLKPM